MKDPALLAHGLGVGDGGGEEAVHLDPAVQTGPLIVPVAGVGEAPGDQGVLLPVRRVTLLLPVGTAAHASQSPAARSKTLKLC